MMMMMMMMMTRMCAAYTFAVKKSCVLLLVELLPGLCWCHNFMNFMPKLITINQLGYF